MTTIHELRTNLEAAQAAYLSADIEHPTASILAKEALTNARFEYWAGCADLVTRMPAAIKGQGVDSIIGIYTEITGEPL